MRRDLDTQTERTHDGVKLTLSGAVTENSELKAVAADVKGKVAMDLHGIQRINSIGVREWIEFMKLVCGQSQEVTLRRCSPAMVRQFNMITTMQGRAKVASVMLPYLCNACGNEHTTELEVTGPATTIPPTATCPSCKEAAEFDDLADEYLGFLKR